MYMRDTVETVEKLICFLKFFAYFSDSSEDGNSPILTIQHDSPVLFFFFFFPNVFPRNGQIWDVLGWMIISSFEEQDVVYCGVR